MAMSSAAQNRQPSAAAHKPHGVTRDQLKNQAAQEMDSLSKSELKQLTEAMIKVRRSRETGSQRGRAERAILKVEVSYAPKRASQSKSGEPTYELRPKNKLLGAASTLSVSRRASGRALSGAGLGEVFSPEASRARLDAATVEGRFL